MVSGGNKVVLDDPVPGRHLLIASTGGHLAQLVKWSRVLRSHPDSLFVTFKNAQSESLLAGRRVMYVPYVAPRNMARTVTAFRLLHKDIDWRGEGFTAAITTGAAVGLAGLAAAHIHRVPSFYFESVSRVNGPSLTGKIAGLDPWIRRYCQYDHWANRRWNSRSSLFETYARVPKSPVTRPQLFVTLGTIQPYRFDALVDSVLSTGLADDRTVWQLGVTTRHGLPGKTVTQFNADEFDRCARDADVVVTHAGVGTIMHLLEMGIYPVVVPRRAIRKEHVDDHQVQIANLIHAKGIALVRASEDLTSEVIVEASSAKVMNSRPVAEDV